MSNAIANSKTQRDTETLSTSVNPALGQGQYFGNASLISKFIESANSSNQKRHETELKKIQESHKIDKPEARNIFHMVFS